MVRQRTPARGQSKPQLGESWVVESDAEGDDEYSPPVKTSARDIEELKHSRKLADSAEISRKRTTRASAEPEFIMPSIHVSNQDESSVGGGESGYLKEQGKLRGQKQKPRSENRHRMAANRDEDSTMQDNLLKTSEDVRAFITPIFSWIYDVLGKALHTLKTPISYLIAVWLLVGLTVFLRNLLFSSVYSALSPICRLPGTQYLNLPMCHPSITAEYTGDDPPPVQFDQLTTIQNKFDAILRDSAGGVSLPLDMKRGETSIRDLRQVVRFSQLHSKNELVLEFDGFIETARIASYDLQKFNSHVGRGVDNILATARWTKRVLEGIAERDASQGAVASFFNGKLLAPFQPLKFTEDALLDQYIQHTRVVEEEINRLVAEAQALLLVLQNLEDRLDVIHGIAIRDNLHTQGSRAEVLSQLWTMLGGNRSKLGKFDTQLRLLGQVNTYRQNAIAHVSGTLLKLQSMGAELEELRERVGGVEVLGTGKVPLSVHVENIELGVERLEKGRRGAREMENEELRRTLERGKGQERMIEGT